MSRGDHWEKQALAHKWYVAYDHKDEYDLNPKAVRDVSARETEMDVGDHTIPVMRFYILGNRDSYIESDQVYNLMRNR